MNPVEYLWNVLDRSLCKKHGKTDFCEELLQIPYSTWVEFPQLKIAELVTSMPDRVKTLEDTKGALIKY